MLGHFFLIFYMHTNWLVLVYQQQQKVVKALLQAFNTIELWKPVS